MKKYLSAYTPSLGELWLVILALLCLGGSLVIAIVMVILRQFIEVDLSVLLLALYPLTFSVVIPFVWIRAKRSYEEKSIKGEPIPQESPSFGSLPAPILFLLLLVLTVSFGILIEPLTMWMNMPDFMKEISRIIGSHGWLSFLSLVVMAPLLEEWLCRGVILKGLLNRGYSPAVAIVWSASMFGVMHMNPYQAIPAFLVGLLLGWIYWRTRSLWTVIFIHAVNNGISVALTRFFPDIPDDITTYDLVGPAYYYWIFATALLLTLSIVYLLHKKLSYHRAP